MRRFCEISVVVLMLVCVWACKSWSGYRVDDKEIACVGKNCLYLSELSAAMPDGVTETDSLNFAKTFVSKWIVGQLKQQEAELLFSESEDDIEKMVEEYRRSLLVHRLDRHYLEAEPCGEITDEDMMTYYKENKSNFRLSEPMVKGEIVAIGEDFRRREQMIKWFDAPQGEHRADFEELCRKNNFTHLQFEEWTSFAEFLSNLPLLRTSRHEALLGKRGVQTIHYDKTYFYFRITDVLKEGDTTPFGMAKEGIRQILVNRHQAEVVRRQEERMLKSALTSGHARIHGEEEQNEKGQE